MELASCFVALGGDKGGTEVFLEGVTPAEALVLRQVHGGVECFRELKVADHVTRDGAVEVKRLIEKYPRQDKLVKSLFPGYQPQLPQNFAEVMGEEVHLPSQPAPAIPGSALLTGEDPAADVDSVLG